MIIVIVRTEHNKTTGRMEPIVSHGIDLDTERTVILPQEHPREAGAIFDHEFGEYIIRGKTADLLATASKASGR